MGKSDKRSSSSQRHDQIQSIGRALTILEELADHDSGLSLKDLSNSVHLYPSTTHRILSTLMAHDFVLQDPMTRKYRLGLHLIRIGQAASTQLDLAEEAMPVLKALALKVDEVANLVLLSRDEAVYIAQANGRRTGAMHMFTRTGARVPLHCTGVGKCLLAHMPEVQLAPLVRPERLVAFTPNTITNPLQLRSELEKVRTQGYAVDDEEREVGVRCISSPVWDAMGEVVAAISISAPAGRFAPDRFEGLGKLVRQSALKLSGSLGYQPVGALVSSHHDVMGGSTSDS